MDDRLQVRISTEDKKLIEEAAWRRKVKPAEWIRSVLVATAKDTIEKTSPKP